METFLDVATRAWQANQLVQQNMMDIRSDLGKGKDWGGQDLVVCDHLGYQEFMVFSVFELSKSRQSLRFSVAPDGEIHLEENRGFVGDVDMAKAFLKDYLSQPVENKDLFE